MNVGPASHLEETGRLKNRVAQKGPDPYFNEKDFPEVPPQPVYGVEYMPLISSPPLLYGLYGPQGRPDDTLFSPDTRIPISRSRPEYRLFVGAVKERKSGLELERAAKQVLEDLNLWGHSMTGYPEEMAEGVFQVFRFGLWPEIDPATGKYIPHPWAGSFKSGGGTVSAGSFFGGFAVAFDPNEVSPVEIPDLKTSFSPPGDLVFILPDERTKRAFDRLVGASRLNLYNPELVRKSPSPVYTLQDVVDGKLVTEFRKIS